MPKFCQDIGYFFEIPKKEFRYDLGMTLRIKNDFLGANYIGNTLSEEKKTCFLRIS